MKTLGSVIFFGRANCIYSKNIKKYLKKNSRKFYYIESHKPNEKHNIQKFEKLHLDYIFCFRSFYILKKNLIEKCNIAAINFHPGTPKYRGIGCINFALYNDEKIYGCTSHLINKNLDNGKILDVRKFKILKNDTVYTALRKTYSLMALQAFSIIKLLLRDKKNLNTLINKNKKIKWSKRITKRSDLNKLYLVKKEITQKKLSKIIRATNTDLYKPYIYLHKKKFILSEE